MNEVDYEVCVWRMPDRWVDVSLRGSLHYSRSNGGSGMQAMAEEGSPEWHHVMALCDGVRDAVLALDDYLWGLEDDE